MGGNLADRHDGMSSSVRQYSLRPAVVDDTNVYFFDEAYIYDALFKISKTGGEVTRIDGGYSSGVIAQTKADVFFAGLDDIYSFTK